MQQMVAKPLRRMKSSSWQGNHCKFDGITLHKQKISRTVFILSFNRGHLLEYLKPAHLLTPTPQEDHKGNSRVDPPSSFQETNLAIFNGIASRFFHLRLLGGGNEKNGEQVDAKSKSNKFSATRRNKISLYIKQNQESMNRVKIGSPAVQKPSAPNWCRSLLLVSRWVASRNEDSCSVENFPRCR